MSDGSTATSGQRRQPRGEQVVADIQTSQSVGEKGHEVEQQDRDPQTAATISIRQPRRETTMSIPDLLGGGSLETSDTGPSDGDSYTLDSPALGVDDTIEEICDSGDAQSVGVGSPSDGTPSGDPGFETPQRLLAGDLWTAYAGGDSARWDDFLTRMHIGQLCPAAGCQRVERPEWFSTAQKKSYSAPALPGRDNTTPTVPENQDL